MKWGLQGLFNEPANARGETLLQKRTFAPLVAGNRCVMLIDGYYEWRNNFKTESDDEEDPEEGETLSAVAPKPKLKKPSVSRVALKDAVKKQPFFFRPRDPSFPVLMVAAFFKPSAGQTPISSPISPFPHPTPVLSSSSCASSASSSIFTPSSSATTRSAGGLSTFALVTVAAHPDFAAVHHRMPAVLTDVAAVKKWLFGPRPMEALRAVGADFIEHYPVGASVGSSSAEGEHLIKPVKAKDPYAGPLDRFIFKAAQLEHEAPLAKNEERAQLPKTRKPHVKTIQSFFQPKPLPVKPEVVDLTEEADEPARSAPPKRDRSSPILAVSPPVIKRQRED